MCDGASLETRQLGGRGSNPMCGVHAALPGRGFVGRVYLTGRRPVLQVGEAELGTTPRSEERDHVHSRALFDYGGASRPADG